MSRVSLPSCSNGLDDRWSSSSSIGICHCQRGQTNHRQCPREGRNVTGERRMGALAIGPIRSLFLSLHARKHDPHHFSSRITRSTRVTFVQYGKKEPGATCVNLPQRRNGRNRAQRCFAQRHQRTAAVSTAGQFDQLVGLRDRSKSMATSAKTRPRTAILRYGAGQLSRIRISFESNLKPDRPTLESSFDRP